MSARTTCVGAGLQQATGCDWGTWGPKHSKTWAGWYEWVGYTQNGVRQRHRLVTSAGDNILGACTRPVRCSTQPSPHPRTHAPTLALAPQTSGACKSFSQGRPTLSRGVSMPSPALMADASWCALSSAAATRAGSSWSTVGVENNGVQSARRSNGMQC